MMICGIEFKVSLAVGRNKQSMWLRLNRGRRVLRYIWAVSAVRHEHSAFSLHSTFLHLLMIIAFTIIKPLSVDF